MSCDASGSLLGSEESGGCETKPAAAHRRALRVPGVVGLRRGLGFQSTCPGEGETFALPSGHVLVVRNHEQRRVLPMCSERMHQYVT